MEIPVQRHCPMRGRDAFCWQPWEPLPLLFLTLIPTYSSQTLSAAGVPAQAPVVKESCEELGRRARVGGEGKMWRGLREDGGSQQPERDLRRGSALCPDQWCWSLTISMVFSGPNKAGGPATEHDHLHSLQSQCVQPRFGWVLVRVFLPSQGSDYQSLRVNGSWCHCWLRRSKTTTSYVGP